MSTTLNPLNLDFDGQITARAVTDGDTRIQIERNVHKPAVYTDLLMYRDTRDQNVTGAGFGGTSSQFLVANDAGSLDCSQWSVLSTLNITGAGAGQHCALYGQVNKRANSSGWAACLEFRDHIGNNTTSSVALEVGIGGNGLDDNGVRYGVDISYNSGQPFWEGDNVISGGLRIGPAFGNSEWAPGYSNSDGTAQHAGRVYMKKGIELKGLMQTGIDLTGLNPGFSNEAIRFSSGHVINWSNGAALGANADYLIMNGPPGSIRGSQPMPANTLGSIVVNVGGVGPCRIPLLPF